ncbi:MAG: 6-bladed beta-propeller [Prevotellaceae bacterium]|jgi:hypothetical protein|nr:6-bladed beta-propeller [Prevotellaceae bacterium]
MNKLGRHGIYLYLLFVTLIFCISCKEKKMQGNDDIIVIDPSKAKPGLLSEILDSISYIKLANDDECLLNYIDRIKYFDKQYYIYDRGAQTIYVFDETGKYVKKFNKYGRGAGEYLLVTSFVKDDKGRLHIYDAELSKILTYDTSGNFVSGINMTKDDHPRDFMCFDDKYMLHMPDENIGARHGSFVFDPETGAYTEIMHIDEWEDKDVLTNVWNIIDRNESGYSLINGYSNIVYNMKHDKTINKFQFDIQPRFSYKTEEGYQMVRCSETDNVLMARWMYRKGRNGDHDIICFYNKNTKALKIYKDIKNDIDKRTGKLEALNNNIVYIISGETDETGFELNPWLQIWHLKNVEEMP